MHPAATPTHRVTPIKTGPAHGRHHGDGGGVLKSFLTLLMCLCVAVTFPACQSAQGTGWKYRSFATDTEGLDVSAEGIKAQTINQSTAFGKVTDTIKGMWTNYLLAEGLKYVAGKYYDNQGAELSGQQTVKLEELKNAKSAADASAALETLKVTTAAEGAVPGL